MAAPSHLFTHKVVSQKTGRADKLVLLTSASESSTVLKSRFYLDGFFIREHNGVKKWAGYCVVGSTNYYMHAEARHSWLRERRNGQDIVVFWDAGLNTFPYVESDFSFIKAYTNWMVINALLVKSAFYVDTSEFGVEFKKPTDTVWQKQVITDFVPENTTRNDLRFLDVTSITLQTTTQYQVRFYATNAEGTFYTPLSLFTTQGYLEQMGFYKRTTPCESSGQVFVQMYMDSVVQAGLNSLTQSPQSLGLIAYKSKYTFEEPDSGWYMETAMRILYYQKGTGFTHYQECTPAPSVTLFINILIFDDSDLYTVTALTTDTSSGSVSWTGIASLLNSSSSTIATIPGINVVIPNGQTMASSSGTHNISPSQFANTASTQGATTVISGRGITAQNIQISVSIGSES